MKANEDKRSSRYRRWVLVMAIQFAAVGIFAIGRATAGPIQDLPSSMATSLGTTPDVARMILSSAILLSVGLAMAMVGKRANTMATIIIIISTEGALTGIGWLTPWLLLFTGVLVAAMFAGQIKEKLGA